MFISRKLVVILSLLLALMPVTASYANLFHVHGQQKQTHCKQQHESGKQDCGCCQSNHCDSSCKAADCACSGKLQTAMPSVVQLGTVQAATAQSHLLPILEYSFSPHLLLRPPIAYTL